MTSPILYYGYTPTKAHADLEALWARNTGASTYNVADYGAVPNATTDAWNAFQAAANAIPATGGVLYVPPGRYRVYDTVDIRVNWAGGLSDGSSTRVQLDPGAIVELWSPIAGKSLFRITGLSGQDTNVVFNSGQLDGTHAATGCHGIEIHSMNVTVQDMAIRNFATGRAVHFVYDLAAPAICCNLLNLKLKSNYVGVWNDASAAQLNIAYCRIEDNFSYGVYSSGGSKMMLWGNTIENNGYLAIANIGVWPVASYPPQVFLENVSMTLIYGNWFESFANQPHDELVMQGNALPAGGYDVRCNQFTNYGQTCVNVGANGASVRAVIVEGNSFSMTSGVGIRMGQFVLGFKIGVNQWSDSFADGGTAIRAVVNPGAIGTIEDQNHFVSSHTITHQLTDLTAASLTSLGLVAGGNTSSDQASGGASYRPLRIKGRVTAGSNVRGDIESVIANLAMLNVVAGTLPIFPNVALAGAGAGNVDNGAHSYKITFVDAAGESTGGPASSVLTVVDKTANGQVALTSIAAGNSPVTARKVYRTKVGGTAYFLVGTIADNATTTFTDNIADASLGAAMPATSTTADLGAILSKLALGIGAVGTVDAQPMTGIAGNVEQMRWDTTGLFNSRLGYKVAGVQVLTTQQASAAQAAVTLGNADNAIGGLTISAAYSQAEVTALRNACETLADDVRALSVLIHAMRTAGVTHGHIKGSA